MGRTLMSNELVAYLNSINENTDLLFKEIEQQAAEEFIPIVSKDVANYLYLTVKIQKPEKVLEIGTASGYSTIHIARALPEKGKITGIELSEKRIIMARKNFAKAGFADEIEILQADIREEVFNLNGIYDFIFLDACKAQYAKLFTELQKNMKSGSIFIADNVLLNGWIIDKKYPIRRRKTMVERMDAFLKFVLNEPSYDSSLLPVGDGLLIVRKK